LDLQYKDGSTALHAFAEKGFPRFTRMIIEMGADVNIQNDHGNTPLHLAVTAGHSLVVREILKRNPQLDKKDKHENTVVDIIKEHRKEYLQFLPTEIHSDQLFGLLNEVSPVEETLSDDDDVSEIETESGTKKENSDTQQDKNKRKEEEKKKIEIEESSESESLDSEEELKIEKKAIKKMKNLTDTSPVEQQKEKQRIMSVLRNIKMEEKKLKSKERKLLKKREQMKKKDEEEQKDTNRKKEEQERNEREKDRKKRKLEMKKLKHVVVTTVVDAIGEFENEVKTEIFLKNWLEKRQESHLKNQRSAQMLGRLRELLNHLRQGIGDDEFNYKEVVDILRNL